LGAEGLAAVDGEVCLLADEPASFAAKILTLFDNAEAARGLASRARQEVEANWDLKEGTRRLVETYREAVCRKRSR
jgi:glycosyltransferase involved in cell wall biosynthesis